MDPRQIKKKELTFRAGKKTGNFWIISAWILIIFFTISCVAIIVNKTPKDKESQNAGAPKVSEDQAELEYWQKQFAQDPNNTINLSNLAYYYQKTKKYTDAEQYYKKALKLDPKYKFALKNLGIVYVELKKYDDAQQLWTNALKTDPNNSDYYLGLCELSIEKKNYDEAISYAEKVIKIDPGNLNVYEMLAYIYKIQGDTKQAIKALNDGIDIAKLSGDSRAQAKFSFIINEMNPKKAEPIESKSK